MTSGAAPAAGSRPRQEPEADREERELSALLDALRLHRGNLARASASIGVSRQRAYRLIGDRTSLDIAQLRNEVRGKPK